MPSGQRLVVVEPNGTRRDVVVIASPFRIGRQAGNELTLRDSRVSRHQAQILTVEGKLVLEDMGSSHGTFVNGEKILRHELKPSDQIDFGVADSYHVIYVGDGATIEEIVERIDAPAPDSRARANFITWACCWRWPALSAPGSRSKIFSPPFWTRPSP